MPINSRQKGARAEREVAHILQEYGYNARRGQQYSGTNGDADVIGLKGFHLEIKRVEKLNIEKAMEQARNDARIDEIPAVIHRRNHEVWKATMDFAELIKMQKRTEELEAEIERLKRLP